MDFVSGLPRTSGGYDTIWVIVDRPTKSAHFIPTHSSYSAERPAQIYIREVVRPHGVPVSIISDRGTRFTSRFWRGVRRGLGTEVHLSIAFHPRTDGRSSGLFMAPFEALYGRRCRSPIGWFDGFESRIRYKDLPRDSLNHVRLIQDRLRAAQSRQKSYADRGLCAS
ncbi:unnamed protein product [Withania somnifera]